MLARVHQDCQKCTPQIHLLPLVTHPTHTPPPETVRTLKPAVARQVVKWNERTKSYDHFPEPLAYYYLLPTLFRFSFLTDTENGEQFRPNIVSIGHVELALVPDALLEDVIWALRTFIKAFELGEETDLRYLGLVKPDQVFGVIKWYMVRCSTG